MKKYIYTFALLALALTACNKEAEAPQEEIGKADATVYQVSIPASMGADTKAVSFDNSTNPPTASTSFQATDKVYLYNKTTSKWISYNSGTSSFEYLSPSNLTGEGKSCDLTGTITGTISEDDEILLLYNMNHLDSDPTECAYNYRDQDGTAEGVLDGAIATLKVKGINGGVITFCQVSDENDETAHFQNLQSMFRFKFTAGGEPVNVKRFSIRAEHAMLAYTFMPIPPADADYDWGAVGASLATHTSDYIYIGLLFEDGGNYNIHFLVTDADGKVYTGSKAAPSGGFQNGRYYYNTNAIDLTYQYTLAEPTITWTTPSVAVNPSFANWYIIPDNNADISLSGNSLGYGFWLQQNATVRLNDFTGTYPVTDNIFLEGDGNLTIEVNGTNSIVNANDYAGICTYMGDVKLCGNGTLSITSNDENHYGIEADNYDGSDVSVLAALGHTVTRSDMTDNGDGTYTWTYTVVNHWVHLNELTGNYEAQDGDWLTGELPGNLKLEIAAGATVTLAGITINGGDDWDTIWAGITCEGDATLELADGTDNLVKPFMNQFAAISVPSGKTLTIQGSGSLTADARSSSGAGIGGDALKYYGNIVITGAVNVTAYGGIGGAGIGGGACDINNAVTGSDITINTSGTVKAYGGDSAAGIGAGASRRDQDNRCGNILISKGTVEAIGGEYGAGIGTGYGSMGSSICGTITITDGVTSVTATKGANAGNCIGRGYSGPCGTVTVAADLTDTGEGSNTRIITRP